MVCGPVAVGVSPTALLALSLHDALPILAPPRVQLAKALLARSALKLTVPLGAVAEPGVASVTVAVQLVGLSTGTKAGEQTTAVLVSCLRAVTTVAPLEPS